MDAAAAAAVGAVDPSGSSGTVGGACLPVPIIYMSVYDVFNVR